MKHLNVINGVTRAFNKVGFTLRKHSPEILVVAGCVGTAVSAVMACKATLKVNEIADEAKKNVEKIHDAVENGVTMLTALDTVRVLLDVLEEITIGISTINT